MVVGVCGAFPLLFLFSHQNKKLGHQLRKKTKKELQVFVDKSTYEIVFSDSRWHIAWRTVI